MDDNKELDELLKEVADVPPITGDMVRDYTGLLNKEMAAVREVWSEYNSPENKEISQNNPFITNHMVAMCNMYEELLIVADAAKNPDTLELILNKFKESQQGEDKTQPETEG